MEVCLAWKAWEAWEAWEVWEAWVLMEGLAALVSIPVWVSRKNSLKLVLDFSKLGGGAGGDMPDLGDMGDMGDDGADDDDDDDEMPALEDDDEADKTGDSKGKEPEKHSDTPAATGSKIEEVA